MTRAQRLLAVALTAGVLSPLVAVLLTLSFGGAYLPDAQVPIEYGRAQAANVDFATVRANATHAATVSAQGFMTASQAQGNDGRVQVAAATTAALPAFTRTSNTLTADAVGAFPTLDGSVTLVANDPIYGAFLLQNAPTPADNGVWLLTVQGSGGAAWVATRHPAADTSAEVIALKVRVRGGQQSAGGEYDWRGIAAFTLNTTPFYLWRTDVGMTGNEGIDQEDDFLEVTPYLTNAPGGPAAFTRAVNGTGAAFSTASVNDTSTVGVQTVVSGTLATNMGGVSDSWTAANTQPDGGGCFAPGTDVSYRVEARVKYPTLSTSGQRYNSQFGLMKQRAGSQTSSADGCYFQYYDATSTNFNAICATAGTGVGSPTATGVPVVADTWYRLVIVHYAGDGNVYFFIDGTLVATISANVPTAEKLGLAAFSFKTVGTSSVSFLTVDRVRKSVRWHKRRAA